MSTIAERLEHVRQQIAAAERASGRPQGSVKLIAVSKFHPASAIREAYAAGQRDFGENYVQELVSKAAELRDLAELRFHLIGHLQSNKARQVVGDVSWVHTLDGASTARELNKRAQGIAKIISVLIQVNVANEAQKSGCQEEELPGLIQAIQACSHLRYRGLMVIPPLADDPETSRPYFARLRAMLPGLPPVQPDVESTEAPNSRELGELSMGMSHDLEVAIAEGATMVRVGTAIFGERPLTKHEGA
ncbi:MAG: YggS family pyridoxal phosphate-dependent enzyme [Polyangiaceae bacterium]